MHQKRIANIKTLCKYREKSINYSLYVFVFQYINLQSQVRQSSSDLWIIWSTANKNGSIFSSLEKVKEQRNNNGSSDSIRGSCSRWHKNVGQMSSTQTNSPAEVKNHELSECLLEGLHGSASSSSRSGPCWKQKITHGSEIVWGCSICQIHGPDF